MPIDVLVGQNIRICRLQQKFSQTELGRRIGVTFQQVQKYEKGANRVGASRLSQIADTLGVPLVALFDGSTTATQHVESEDTPRAPRQSRSRTCAGSRIARRIVRRTFSACTVAGGQFGFLRSPHLRRRPDTRLAGSGARGALYFSLQYF
jgi:transcriptional regulator with XRE-family HTH domain